ncbi:MAG: hypothetical protein AB1439_01950 [candidate division FCPU426 bacterium]
MLIGRAPWPAFKKLALVVPGPAASADNEKRQKIPSRTIVFFMVPVPLKIFFKIAFVKICKIYLLSFRAPIHVKFYAKKN